MSVRLLLDEHISPDVADLLIKNNVDTIPMQEWHDGNLLSQSDEQILMAAAAENRALATFDVRSIPVVLRHFAEAGVDHGGVIFISDKTIGQGDIGGIARALLKLSKDYENVSLKNQVLFLSR